VCVCVCVRVCVCVCLGETRSGLNKQSEASFQMPQPHRDKHAPFRDGLRKL